MRERLFTLKAGHRRETAVKQEVETMEFALHQRVICTRIKNGITEEGLGIVVNIRPLKVQFLEDLQVGHTLPQHKMGAYMNWNDVCGHEVVSCRAATRGDIDAAVNAWGTEHDYKLARFNREPMGR